MSGEAETEEGNRLNLNDMPISFHPAATWTRVIIMSLMFFLLLEFKPIGRLLVGAVGEVGIVISFLGAIFEIGLLFFCMGTRIERWFPRPKSTRSWASRTAIGWNLEFSRDASLSREFKRHLRWDVGSIFLSVMQVLHVFFLLYPERINLPTAMLVCTALAFLWNDEKRRLADEMAKTDARVAALIY